MVSLGESNSILSQTENKNTLSLVSENDLKFFLEQSVKSSNVVLSPSNIKSLKLHGALLSSKSDGNLPQFFSIYPFSAYKELHTLIITDIKYHTDVDGTEFNVLMSQAAQLKSLHILELRSSAKNSGEILQNLINMIFEEENLFLSLKRCRFDFEYGGYIYFQRIWMNRPPKLTKIEYLILPYLLFASFLELTACLPAVKSIKVAGNTIHPEPRQVMPRRTILPLCTSFTLICSYTSLPRFHVIFGCFPNLQKLIVITNLQNDLTFTELEWERILSRQILKLKKFQLTLHKSNQTRTTFTGNFWLERRTFLVYDITSAREPELGTAFLVPKEVVLSSEYHMVCKKLQ